MSIDGRLNCTSLEQLILRISPVTPDLLQPILEFGVVHYPSGSPNVDREYLCWLCLKNPAGVGEAVLIEDRGRMVGLALLIPVHLLLDGRRQLSYFVVNVLTHPSYRNRRLFSQIIDAAKAHCIKSGAWLMGHPNSAALPGWKRKGMKFRAPLSPMVAGLGVSFGRRTTYLDTEEKLLREWPAFSELLTPPSGVIGIARDVDFMRWRFLARPDRRYRIAISQCRKGEMAGFYVVRRFKLGLDLLVDYDVIAKSPIPISIDRPCIAMVPADRMTEIGAEIRGMRLPLSKKVPFFASSFDGCTLDFSRITLAASDF